MSSTEEDSIYLGDCKSKTDVHQAIFDLTKNRFTIPELRIIHSSMSNNKQYIENDIDDNNNNNSNKTADRDLFEYCLQHLMSRNCSFIFGYCCVGAFRIDLSKMKCLIKMGINQRRIIMLQGAFISTEALAYLANVKLQKPNYSLERPFISLHNCQWIESQTGIPICFRQCDTNITLLVKPKSDDSPQNQINLEVAHKLVNAAQELAETTKLSVNVLEVTNTAMPLEAFEFLLQDNVIVTIVDEKRGKKQLTTIPLQAKFLNCKLQHDKVETEVKNENEEEEEEEESQEAKLQFTSGKFTFRHFTQPRFTNFDILTATEAKLVSNALKLLLAVTVSSGTKTISIDFANCILALDVMQDLFDPILQIINGYGSINMHIRFLRCSLQIENQERICLPEVISWKQHENSFMIPPEYAATNNNNHKAAPIAGVMKLVTFCPPFANSVTCLNLNGNRIDNDGMNHICQHLNDSNIQELLLSSTNMNNDHLTKLASTIRFNPKLKHLNISNNEKITSHGMMELLDILQHNNNIMSLGSVETDVLESELEEKLEYCLGLNYIGRKQLLQTNTGLSVSLYPTILGKAAQHTNPSVLFWMIRSLPQLLMSYQQIN